MSTPVSDHHRLRLATVGTVAALVALANVSLQVLARQVESRGVVYPYKYQDWLRYLLPTLWPTTGKPLLLLTGPSTMREDVRVHELAAAFPRQRVYQGALSLGTLGDVMASLEYVERAYGAAALPRVLVIGISHRFLAELPADRPFARGLEMYSPRYRVASGSATGFGLVERPRLDGLVARGRFKLRRQRSRYRTAVTWATASLAGPDLSADIAASGPMRLLARSAPLRRTWLGKVAAVGIYQHGMDVVGPYRYAGEELADLEGALEQLDNPRSWWPQVHRWDPDTSATAIRERGAALRAFIARHGIEAYVVNLPERSETRRHYLPGTEARYQSLVGEAFSGLPYLDLRCLLSDDQFRDTEHATTTGALRLTARVVTFVRAMRGVDDGGPDPVVAARATRSLSAPCRSHPETQPWTS